MEGPSLASVRDQNPGHLACFLEQLGVVLRRFGGAVEVDESSQRPRHAEPLTMPPSQRTGRLCFSASGFPRQVTSANLLPAGRADA